MKSMAEVLKETGCTFNLPKWNYWSCEEEQIASDALSSPEIGKLLQCCICQSCWINCSQMCLISTIYARNRISRTAIRRVVQWQKAALEGSIRG